MLRRVAHDVAPAAVVALAALGGCAADGDEAAGDVGAVDTVLRLDAAPPASPAPCAAAAGWTWYRDVSTPYCPHQPDAGSDPYCEPSVRCFCALPCESDADCAAFTAHWCRPVALFDGSDASSCRGDRRVCTSKPGFSEDACLPPPYSPDGCP